MKPNQKLNIYTILLAPILFVIDFFKHVFIGLKFVFFDVFYNMITYSKARKEFNRIERQSVNLNTEEETQTKKEEEPIVMSLEERKHIAYEKQELIREMQKEIKSRKVVKSYYYY